MAFRLPLLMLMIGSLALAMMILRTDPPAAPTLSMKSSSFELSSDEPSLSAHGDAAPKTIRPPRIVDLDGTLHAFPPDVHTLNVFVFVATTCPISNQSIPALNRLASRFPAPKTRLFAVYPESAAHPEDIRQHARDYGIAFPTVRDADQQLTRLFKATRTPEVIVLHEGKIRYRGRIDDRFADVTRPRLAASQHDLADALASIHAGVPVLLRETNPVGCLISSSSRSVGHGEITFAEHIAPILQAECAACHRPGESAPFPLLTHADAVTHGKQIVEVVRKRLMPPWKPSPQLHEFRNERRLSEHQITLIENWVGNGMPSGDLRILGAPVSLPTGWQLGQPDLILELPESFPVPADGPDIYQHFVLPSGLTENRLIAAMEFRPGDPSVVHHAIVYFDDQHAARKLDAADPSPGYESFGSPGFTPSGSLGGWGPGGLPRLLPDGVGRPMRAGTDVVLQIHYHPIGRKRLDRSRLGLYFAPSDASYLATEIMVADVELQIPANERRHVHHAEYTLPVETCLLDASPHMHVLGSRMTATAYLPDGTREQLIDIPAWDFYWQDHYVFARPVWLPAGTRIEVIAEFNNSSSNSLNPNSPPVTVNWGDHSTDEMAICYFQVTNRSMADYTTLNTHSQAYYQAMLTRLAEKERRQP